MKKTILFDFDGTIADSLQASIDVYNTIAPRFFALPVPSHRVETIRSDRLQRFFKYFNVHYFMLPFMVITARKEFAKKITTMQPQLGICEILITLKNEGYTIGILTSNSKKNIHTLLKKFNLADQVDFVKNSTNIFGKDSCIKSIMKERLVCKEDLIFVADETRDIEAAQKIGITMIAVTWGFQNRRALSRVKPTYIIDSPKELLSIIHSAGSH